MKMYQHLDDLPNSLGKTECFFQRNEIFFIPNKIIGCIVTLLAGCLIWLCCYSLSKCIFNRWQLLKEQMFWTAIIMAAWLALLHSLRTTSTNRIGLNTNLNGAKRSSIRYFDQLLQVLRKTGIGKNTK